MQVTEDAVVEQIKCAGDFKYFLSKCCLVVAPTMDKPGGVKPMEMWPHIISTADILLKERLIVWMKSRQVGASWLIAAYVLWFATSHKGASILLLSKDEIAGVELLDKVKRLEKNLPNYLKFEADEYSKLHIHYSYWDSHIRVFAATETAGVSFTASMVVCDEWEQQQYARRNFDEIKPTVDAGGQFIGIFTPNPEDPSSFAKSKFIGALSGDNGFMPIFTPYDCVPGRDEEWWEARYKEASCEGFDLDGVGSPDLYMARNYPRSIDEALAPLRTSSAFDREALDNMMGKTENPLKLANVDIDQSICHVYQRFLIGEAYVCGTDTSHGVGKDYSVSVILDCNTGAVVADICSTTLTPEALAYHTVKLLKLYADPIWFIEDNDWGRTVISTAQNLGYRNLGYRDADKKHVGWHTGDVSRFNLFGALIPAVNNGHITIFNKEGVKQLYDCIKNAKKDGRIEAKKGGHDDYPIALGIAYINRNKALNRSMGIYNPTFY